VIKTRPCGGYGTMIVMESKIEEMSKEEEQEQSN
jgi:hypothetical protein